MYQTKATPTDAKKIVAIKALGKIKMCNIRKEIYT